MDLVQQLKAMQPPVQAKQQNTFKIVRRYAIFELSSGTHQTFRRADSKDFLDSHTAEQWCAEILKLMPEKVLTVFPIFATKQQMS